MGQDMAQANIFTGLTGPAPPPKPVHVVLEEAYRTIWLDRRVQEGEAAIAHMVNDETLAAHSPLLHLRAQLLHAEVRPYLQAEPMWPGIGRAGRSVNREIPIIMIYICIHD